jgi:hypothetical protein
VQRNQGPIVFVMSESHVLCQDEMLYRVVRYTTVRSAMVLLNLLSVSGIHHSGCKHVCHAERSVKL